MRTAKHRKIEKERDNLLKGEEGGGSQVSYDGKKAWFSTYINHSILSDIESKGSR